MIDWKEAKTTKAHYGHCINGTAWLLLSQGQVQVQLICLFIDEVESPHLFVLPREGGSLISIKYIIIDSEGKEGEESDTADKQSDIQEGHINFLLLIFI